MAERPVTILRAQLERRPLLHAMATRVDWRDPDDGSPEGSVAKVTFDGVALPEKWHGEMFIPAICDEVSANTVHLLINDFFLECERQLAQQMKRIGTGR